VVGNLCGSAVPAGCESRRQRLFQVAMLEPPACGGLDVDNQPTYHKNQYGCQLCCA
jgi:hypothetical protein